MRQKGNRYAKHFVSMLLSLVLVLGMTPATVFAAGNRHATCACAT